MGRADWLARQTTLPAAIKSTELAPGNSAYLRHAAEILEANGLPEGGLRERAAGMNPLDSENWIHLAARSEMSGHNQEAEQEFLRAFDVDHQLKPRWALANFYFRAGNSQASLAWACKTLEFDAAISPRYSNCVGPLAGTPAKFWTKPFRVAPRCWRNI